MNEDTWVNEGGKLNIGENMSEETKTTKDQILTKLEEVQTLFESLEKEGDDACQDVYDKLDDLSAKCP
jgi:hypothetical protein